ncbi:hypothetical protein GCM10010420_36570 [Streptomyces glaucosporus]|uniref:Uncharacterized protein n=1 Tax=Streptomyces glaucosporus TaxID=284044 RepID=A0ABN3IJG4_9ACTN
MKGVFGAADDARFRRSPGDSADCLAGVAALAPRLRDSALWEAARTGTAERRAPLPVAGIKASLFKTGGNA